MIHFVSIFSYHFNTICIFARLQICNFGQRNINFYFIFISETQNKKNMEKVEVEFINWIRNFEGSFVDDRVEISQTEYGRGLVAKTFIENGTLLLKIPIKAVVTINDAVRAKEVIRYMENSEDL